MVPLKNILRAVFTVPRCIVCGALIDGQAARFCDQCRKRYYTEKAKSCTRCGFPHTECRCGINVRGGFYRILHIVPYDARNHGAVSGIVYNAKDKYLNENFNFIADECLSLLKRCDIEKDDAVITWIPRRRKTVRKIGHDQSKELAKRIAKGMECKKYKLLVNKGKKAQKDQNYAGRLKNAFSSYRLTRQAHKRSFGKTVILIDDLVTTGATQHVGIELMIDAGAKKVIPLTYAKTDGGFRRYAINSEK